jgi:hypothetical protein
VRTALRSEPNSRAATIASIGRDHELLLIGGVREWYRVQLQDGRSGFVRADDFGDVHLTGGAR